MRHLVKSFCKVHDNAVHLLSCVDPFVEVINELYELCVARQALAETMLIWYQDVMLLEVSVYLADKDMFHHLAADAC